MTYYLGRPGALVALPDPEIGLPQTSERIGATHQLLSGARVRDTVGRMRTWNLTWTALNVTTYGTLESFYYGTNGPGPYYFSDPEQRNWLTPNVSSCSDVTGDVTGFTVPSNVTAATSPFHVTQFFDRSTIQIGESTSVGAGQSVLIASSLLPVVPGLPYALQAYFAVDGNAPAHRIQGWWMDASASGATYGFLDGNNIAAGASGTSTAVGSAPAGTVYLQVRAVAASANVAGVTVFAYTDWWQVEQASAVNPWVPGPGVPLVTVESLSRSTPVAGLCDVQMTLVQVG